MNNRRFSLITLVILLSASLFVGCGSLQPTPVPTVLQPVRLTALPTFPPTAVPSATASPTPLMPSPTPLDPAKDTVYTFFARTSAGDYETAANLYSNFSLMVDEITRGEAAADLKEQALSGKSPSDGVVLESRSFDSRTHLVHVQYTTGKPGKASASTPGAPPTHVDEWWPVRLENGQWRINRAKLIDFQTLDVPVQTTAGLTVKPRQLTRYSDHLRLILLVQNQSNEMIVLGQPNEVLAAFLFGDKTVEAENTRLFFTRPAELSRYDHRPERIV